MKNEHQENANLNELPVKRLPLRTLIENVVNGIATSEEFSELEARLETDGSVREAYLRYLKLHASLRRWYLSANDQPSVLDLSFDASVAQEMAELHLEQSQRQLQDLKQRSSWMTAGLAIAICFLIAVTSVLVFHSEMFKNRDLPVIVKVSPETELRLVDGVLIDTAVGRSLNAGEIVKTTRIEDELVLKYTDGTQITLFGGAELKILNAQYGKRLQLIQGALKADVTPQEFPLVIDTKQTQVKVLGTRFQLATDQETGTHLDLENGKVEMSRGTQMPVTVEENSIAIAPATSQEIIVSPSPTVSKLPIREIETKDVRSITFSSDGQTLIGATNWQAVYWQADNQVQIVPFSKHLNKGVRFSYQAKNLIAFAESNPRKIVIWDANTKQMVHEFSDFDGYWKIQQKVDESLPTEMMGITIATLSPSGDWFAGLRKRTPRIWDFNAELWPDYLQRYDGRSIFYLASSPDGKWLAIPIRRGELDVVDALTGEVQASWSLKSRVPTSIAFSDDNRHLTVAFGQGFVRVYDIQTKTQIAELQQLGLPFTKVAIDPQGEVVAASSPSGKVWLWSVKDQTELHILDLKSQIRDLAFSPSGNQLAVLTRSGTISLWKVDR